MSKPTETPRERFLRVGGTRINNALKHIRLIEQIAGKPYYKYTEAEIAAMLAEMRKAIDSAEEAFSPKPKEKPPLFNLAAVAQESDAPLLEVMNGEAA